MQLKHVARFLITFTLVLLSGISAAYGQFTVERVVDGLNQPIYVTQAPGDNNSLFIVERNDGGNQLGRIREFNQSTQSLTTFLDLTGPFGSDGGVLSMEFHPQYETNGLFYVVSNTNSVNQLDEYQVVGGTPQFQRRLMEYTNLANIHTMNWIGFRPGGNDNELFVTTGDGGVQANANNFDSTLIESLDSPFGKVMRVDLNTSFPTPAADPTHPGVDVVARGFRNAYRASFDRLTGDMYIGDVGFNTAEEINLIPASHFNDPMASPLHFGWTDREGTVETDAQNAGGPLEPGDVQPIFDYAHSGATLAHPSVITGSSVTSGYVYRGAAADIQGRFFFGDFVNNAVYSGTFDSATPISNFDGTNLTDIQDHTANFEALANDDIDFVVSFGEDNAGNVYIVDFGDGFFPPLGTGEIFRIIPTSELTLTVDRDSGGLLLTNSTGSPVDLTSWNLTSAVGAIRDSDLSPITGNYDVNGDQSVDDNDAWQVDSAPGSRFLFSESTTGDAGTIAPSQTVILSGMEGWIPSPTEDLAFNITLSDGTTMQVPVVFAGNDNRSFQRSDLNFDGVIDSSDWPAFLSGNQLDLSSFSPAEAYGMGDLNFDGVNNYEDFLLFQSDFDAANGAGAFSEMLPEPSLSALLFMGLGFIIIQRSRRS